eukprot:673113-Lingulodinium_polyedra.AAC.1
MAQPQPPPGRRAVLWLQASSRLPSARFLRGDVLKSAKLHSDFVRAELRALAGQGEALQQTPAGIYIAGAVLLSASAQP